MWLHVFHESIDRVKSVDDMKPRGLYFGRERFKEPYPGGPNLRRDFAKTHVCDPRTFRLGGFVSSFDVDTLVVFRPEALSSLNLVGCVE